MRVVIFLQHCKHGSKYCNYTTEAQVNVKVTFQVCVCVYLKVDVTYCQIEHGVHCEGSMAEKKRLPEREKINKKCQRLHINRVTQAFVQLYPLVNKLFQCTHHTPCFLHHLLTRLPAGDMGHVAARSAVDGRIGDVTDRQEIGAQASHTKLGHISERLTHTAAKQEASQFLVEARHIAVSHKSP